MKDTMDVEEFESKFLSKYLIKITEKKKLKLVNILKELNEKKDFERIQEIKEEISELDNQLNENLEKIKNKNKEVIEKTDFIELKILNSENDNNFTKFQQNLFREKQNYCKIYGIKEDEFDKHIFETSECIDDLRIPSILFTKIFDFQRESIKWLYTLYNRGRGGILADEMGLGKTLQVITFISALHTSKKLSFALIVCPATILDHWVCEFKKFFPFLRICVFHKEKTFDLDSLLNSFIETKGVLVLSYEGLKKYFIKITQINFNLVILDEGHKIKNQRTMFSQFAKNLKCRSRIVLSGTPMQNNLAELWNLIDFSVPGLLGKYETFKNEFEDKIKKGGYKNARSEDVRKAEELSKYLKQLISPYFLRRTKNEVAKKLPKKSEKIYFCELTKEQENLYKRTLSTDQIFDVLTGKRNALWGIDLLRKICNHCFLLQRNENYLEEEKLINSSGKMIILNELLEKFKEENKKALIFTQTISMMEILEKFCRSKKFTFLKMNGKTPLKERKKLVDKFNSQNDIFIFLLTTKVGGLGLNLVGASRVIIYDPDWNPSSDSQAKERVYRYGQNEDVEIYKLITIDTIEEKILHTQIFKNLLHQKIFNNASLSRFFNKIDLDDLFTYTKNTTKRNRIEEIYNEDISIKKEFSSEEEDLIKFITEREKMFEHESTDSGYENE